jgi:hypothetical protein
MKKTLSFDPKTFQPGINYILVEMIEKKNSKSMAVHDAKMNEFTDVATKNAVACWT